MIIDGDGDAEAVKQRRAAWNEHGQFDSRGFKEVGGSGKREASSAAEIFSNGDDSIVDVDGTLFTFV